MQKMAPRSRFGQTTPPAIFPAIFGLLGLGLAWRQAARVLGAPDAIGELILGAVSLLFLFALAAYARKIARRPGVVAEDLRVLPGRAGLASLVLSLYLLAAVVIPFSDAVARLLLYGGLGVHVGLVALMIWLLVGGPAEQRQVTPVWHLNFVGFIVAPVAAIPLGLIGLSQLILYATAVFALLIWGVSLRQLAHRNPPAPLRPLLAIHLSPASLLGICAQLLGLHLLALVFTVLAVAILAALLLRARYITAAGFSPLWGAFTFPLAAFTSLMLVMAGGGGGGGGGAIYSALGGLALIACSLITPVIAAKVIQAWAKGHLALKTNAARA